MRTNMETDEDFDPVDTDPIIPDKLIDRTLKHLASLRRIDVERKRGTNSWKKINGFQVDSKVEGEPDQNAEVISGLVIMIAQSDHDEHGGTEHYRAKYHVRGKNGQIQRKTFAFKLTDDSDEPEPTLDKLEEQEVLAVAFDRSIALIEIQNRHIDSLNAQMLNQAQTQAGQTAPLLQTIETLVSKYHEGLNMQATALQAVAEMERGVKEAELKAERDKALLDILAVAAPKAVEQFGNYLGRKKEDADAKAEGDGDPASESTIQSRNVARPASEKPPKADPKSVVKPAVASEPEPEPEPETHPDMETKPLTIFAHAFRDSIHSEQWLKLGEALSKQELRLLKRATTAEDDEATAEGIVKFKEALRPTKYLRLNRILDKEQQEMVMKLLEVIDTHEDDPEDEEEEEEPEEEPGAE